MAPILANCIVENRSLDALFSLESGSHLENPGIAMAVTIHNITKVIRSSIRVKPFFFIMKTFMLGCFYMQQN
jgi:hypothetical protein